MPIQNQPLVLVQRGNVELALHDYFDVTQSLFNAVKAMFTIQTRQNIADTDEELLGTRNQKVEIISVESEQIMGQFVSQRFGVYSSFFHTVER